VDPDAEIIVANAKGIFSEFNSAALVKRSMTHPSAVGLQAQLPQHGCPAQEAGFEQSAAVSPRGFRNIQSPVRIFQYPVGIRLVAYLDHPGTDAGRDGQTGPVVTDLGCFDRKPYTFSYFQKVACIALQHQNAEFLASETGYCIFCSGCFLQSPGYSIKHFITGQMPPLIVENLEMVYVEHEHPGVGTMAMGSGYLVFQAAQEIVMVVQAGFRVGYGTLVMEAILDTHGKEPDKAIHIHPFKVGVFIPYNLGS
jgi:hypothetical protein